ncbi:hypothetical protein B0H19DRAFT_1378234 [Mycena capillaripes]|nr:hypothetical protein B0H19DRAFT_1378234 [Mycena capillaripes]
MNSASFGFAYGHNIQKLPPAPTQTQADYRKYKKHGLAITQWLVRTAIAQDIPIVGSPNLKYDLDLKEYLTLSRELVLNRRVQPSREHKARLNTIIKLRKRCWKWHKESMPSRISDKTQQAFIETMREVRQIWFNIQLEYDTPDSDQPETPLVSVLLGSVVACPVRDGVCRDSAEGADEDEDDLSNLPLSAFQFFEEDPEEITAEQAELERALWNHFRELQGYPDCLCDLLHREPTASRFASYLLDLVLNMASRSYSKLAELYPSLEDDGYTTILRAVFRGDDQHISNLRKSEGTSAIRSSLMIDTWVVCRAFISMPEETIHRWADFSYSQDDIDELGQVEAEKGLLMTQFCLRRVSDISKKASINNSPLRRPHIPPITIAAVFLLQLHKDAIWTGRATQDPLRRLRWTTNRIIASVQNWLDSHNPADYGNQAKRLVREMAYIVQCAKLMFEGEMETFLERDPLSRGTEEWILLEKSWEVGKQLITDTSRHRYLATAMSLYVHLRTHASLAKIDAFEYPRKFMVPSSENSTVFYFPKISPTPPLPNGDSRQSLLEWVKEFESIRACVALDAFTIGRMSFAVLETLHRSCQWLLKPYMMRREPDSVRSPSYVRLVQCFIDAWRDGTAGMVQELASRGRGALEHGLNSVAYINPKLNFLY